MEALDRHLTHTATVSHYPRVEQFRLSGCCPAGLGVDLFWLYGSLYVMKEVGDAVPVWDDPSSWIGDVRYDGRYAWMAVATGGKPRVVVVDPQAERSWEIGEDAGLPILTGEQSGDRFHTHGLWVVPLEPGRALVVSFFGR